MLEDMAVTVAQLSRVSFVIEDSKNKPMGRFSFRLPKKKEREGSSIEKVTLSQKPKSDGDITKYLVTVLVSCGKVPLPEKLVNCPFTLKTPRCLTVNAISESGERVYCP